MRYLLLLALLWLCSSQQAEADYRPFLRQYEGMRETGPNRGPFIDSANRRYARLGDPYCASTLSVILDRSKATYPTVRSARARAFITSSSINARLVWEGKAVPPKNSLAVFARKGGGHIEFFIAMVSRWTMELFGFNTSPDGKSGSQWNGVWSGTKRRNIRTACSPYSVFRITHFTEVRYERANALVNQGQSDDHHPVRHGGRAATHARLFVQ